MTLFAVKLSRVVAQTWLLHCGTVVTWRCNSVTCVAAGEGLLEAVEGDCERKMLKKGVEGGSERLCCGR